MGEWHPWDPAGRATMAFGAKTGLMQAPRDAELTVFGRHRPLVSGVPG